MHTALYQTNFSHVCTHSTCTSQSNGRREKYVLILIEQQFINILQMPLYTRRVQQYFKLTQTFFHRLFVCTHIYGYTSWCNFF